MKVETVGYYKFICPVCGKEVGWEISNYFIMKNVDRDWSFNMKLFYPYKIQINTTEQAVYFIKNKCNNIVKQIMEEFNYGKI